MEERIARRREREADAQKLTFFCIETEEVDAEYFLSEIAHRISQQHYSDIEEERSIAGVCGYPMCGNRLASESKELSANQQFRIFNSTNRVFDVSNRRKFCSDWCYAASVYLCDQIEATPVWTRNKPDDGTISNDIPQIIKLYPKSAKGRPGDEVVLNEVLHEMNKIKLGDSIDPAEHALHEHTLDTERLRVPNCRATTNTEARKVNYDQNSDSEKSSEDEDEESLMITTAENAVAMQAKNSPCESRKSKTKSKCLKQTKLISNENRTKYSKNCRQSERKTVTFNLANDSEKDNENQAEIDCARLERNNKLYAQLCNQIMSWKTKETMKFLTEQESVDQNLKSDDFCFKVARFYSKSQEINKSSADNTISPDASLIQIPNLDNKDQLKERREILLRNITKKFNDLKTKFDVNKSIWNEILKLVKTFNLTAENVFVDPTLSDLLLIILMRFVTEIDLIVERDQNSFREFCVVIYGNYGYNDLNELENFVDCFWKI